MREAECALSDEPRVRQEMAEKASLSDRHVNVLAPDYQMDGVLYLAVRFPVIHIQEFLRQVQNQEEGVRRFVIGSEELSTCRAWTEPVSDRSRGPSYWTQETSNLKITKYICNC